jgi:hypothetical protein
MFKNSVIDDIITQAKSELIYVENCWNGFEQLRNCLKYSL